MCPAVQTKRRTINHKYIFRNKKGKIHFITYLKGKEKEGYSLTLSLTSVLESGERSTPRPGRFTSRERDPVPILQEAVRAWSSVWIGTENLAHSGVRTPDRLANSESLYRLCYPGPKIL
jgi:hypothetical protein